MPARSTTFIYLPIMKRTLMMLLCLVAMMSALAGQKAKYVFYFIGDGMGINQVLGAEMYCASLEGRIGTVPMRFASFPFTTYATTYSATNGVTDSAASGTALATGEKTKNGAIGVLADLSTPVSSVALWAKEAGARVGIATSVSVDHATPSAFYAHRGSRNDYYGIGLDLYTAGFDFYAGSDFLQPNGKEGAKNLYELASDYGYSIVRGYDDYLKKFKKSDKLILFQSEAASKVDRSALPYAIDRTEADLSLADITRSAISFLTKGRKAEKAGFFLMVEGGKIDWACHSNDGATVLREVQDLDDAVKVALEFYDKHPHETLIVVTADHETGGMALGTGSYHLNLQALQHQKMSENGFTRHLNGLRAQTKNRVTWEMLQDALRENFGFWGEVKLSERQEKRLKQIWEKSFVVGEADMEKSEYAQNEPIAAEAKRIINEIALLGWTSGGHSAGFVPVFAIGAGAEEFMSRTDNAALPLKIAKVAGYR